MRPFTALSEACGKKLQRCPWVPCKWTHQAREIFKSRSLLGFTVFQSFLCICRAGHRFDPCRQYGLRTARVHRISDGSSVTPESLEGVNRHAIMTLLKAITSYFNEKGRVFVGANLKAGLQPRPLCVPMWIKRFINSGIFEGWHQKVVQFQNHRVEFTRHAGNIVFSQKRPPLGLLDLIRSKGIW